MVTSLGIAEILPASVSCEINPEVRVEPYLSKGQKLNSSGRECDIVTELQVAMEIYYRTNDLKEKRHHLLRSNVTYLHRKPL